MNLKTTVRETVPGFRIPLPPPFILWRPLEFQQHCPLRIVSFMVHYELRGPRANASKSSSCFLSYRPWRRAVRDWLRGLNESDRHAIGKDLLRAQWLWPVGMPLCRAMGKALWEIRTDLIRNRTARVSICFYQVHLVALHGFIKKTRATPESDLLLARRRQKELEQ